MPSPGPLTPVTLPGEHVRLEPLRRSHLSLLSGPAAEPELWAYMGMRGDTPERLARWIDQRAMDEEAGTALPFLQRDAHTGAAIGSTSLFDYSSRHARIEIGHTWIAKSHRGTRVNPEAKLLLLAHAFDGLALERVQLKTDPENERSRRAILKIGAHEEGLLRGYVRYDGGAPKDRVMYSILRAEWPQVRKRLYGLIRAAPPASTVP